jgi:poly-gamma-glutamate capsule biosynthesis protein CapA/YwtB (metallophosphatase superfamily)
MRARTSLTLRPAHHRFHLPPTRAVRLLFVGDLMCMSSDRVPEVCSELRDLIRRADFVVGNCEAPVVRDRTRPDARYLFRFRMAEAYLSSLLDRLGVETRRCVLSVANNHIGDQGAAGLSETLHRLRGLGIIPVGVREGSDPSIRLEAGDVRISLTAWTRWMNRELPDAGVGVWRAKEIDRFGCRSRVGGAPSARVDLRIAFPHWDREFCHFPSAETTRSARRLAAAGFDLIVGHHPHVLQPVEWLAGSVCLYSVGNLNGPTALLRSWPSRMLGAFEVEVSAAGPRRGQIAAYQLHRFVQRRTRDAVRLSTLSELAPQARRRLEQRAGMLYPGPSSPTLV